MSNPPRLSSVAVQERPDDPGLQRSIGWNGAFWIARGVPALVRFSSARSRRQSG